MPGNPTTALRRAAMAMAAALSACAAEPHLPAASAPAPERYTRAALPPQTAGTDEPGGGAQRFTPDWNLPEPWWTIFRSEDLDRVISRALAGSPVLGQAHARLVQAQEDFNARAGADLPQTDANVYARRQRISPEALGLKSVPNPGPFTLYNATVSVSYALDLFGGRRRELEALGASIDYQRYELEAARLTLSANIVTAAVREAALREQIEATRRIISAQERELAIVERRVQVGAAARVDAAAQRAALDQTRAGELPLVRQLEQTRHQLAVYAGLPPSDETLGEFRLDALQLPAELPVSLPSELARQRPDIRAAEALLHKAGAEVGLATANLYPQITLTALGGSQTTHAANLFAGGTEVWNFGASLLQPLFHGGELRAKRRSAIAAYDQAGETYREAVLRGLQNVADALRALQDDALALRARADATAQARLTFETAAGQRRIGSASLLAELAAGRQLDQALLQQAQAQADRLTDTAALIQALGGGWWKKPEASLLH